MALSRVKVWSAGDVLTAPDLNAEINNILNNGQSLVQPWVGNFDLDGNALILDGDADTLIDASTDDTIDVTIGGADDFRFSANTFTALSGSSIVVESGNVTLSAGNVTMTSGDTVYTSGRTLHAKASDVASASSVTVPTTGNVFDLTGTTTVTSFSTSQAGTTFRMRYTGAGATLIYNAVSLITPFATDYRMVTGEIFDLVSLGSGNYYVLPLSGAPAMEPGSVFPWWGSSAPTGGLLCDAAAVNCTTYLALAKRLIPNASTLGNVLTSLNTFTVNAGTDEVTCTSHGLSVGDIIHFTNSGGALPANLSADTVYFVREVVSGSVITLSLTRGGSLHDIQGAGTGTHTLHNKVNTPDLRGRVWVGLDNLGGSAASRITSSSTNGGNSTTLGGAGGAQTHTLITAEMPAHTHTITHAGGETGTPPVATLGNWDATPIQDTGSAGGDGAHSNTQPWFAGGYAIRY